MKKKITPGDEFPTNEGGRVVVLEYGGSRNVSIKHIDDYGYEVKVEACQLRNGQIRNPYRPAVYGIGYIGHGEYKSKVGNANTIEYNMWHNMMTRCYSSKYQKVQPTYIGCTVDERWHNFQVFAEWFHEQRRYEGWQLDKDLLLEGNKSYSPDTCRLIPHELNKLMNGNGINKGDLSQGVNMNGGMYQSRLSVNGTQYDLGRYPTEAQAFAVYKKAKEDNIKRMANIYKEYICPLIYDALMIYDVKP